MSKGKPEVLSAIQRGGWRAKVDDVAAAAGVSAATVSRALRNDKRVADSTRHNVKEIAERLGYHPSSFARGLATQRNSLVAVVVSELENPFYPAFVDKLTQRLLSGGFHPLIVNVQSESTIAESLAPLFEYQVACAIFVAEPTDSDACNLCDKHGIPVILLNRHQATKCALSVGCDNVRGAKTVADLLTRTTHRVFAYIAGRRDTSTNRERLSGYSRTVETVTQSRCIVEQAGAFSYEAGYEAGARLLRKKPKVDAVFCANDIVALGAMDAFRYVHDRVIPEDVSVVGFDDVAQAAWPSYHLTTIRQPVEGMLDSMMSAVRDHALLGRHESTRIRLPGQLIVRTSVRGGAIAGDLCERDGGTGEYHEQ